MSFKLYLSDIDYLHSRQGMDLPGIINIVQWRATCDMCDLWQRFGRAVRTPGLEGTGIMFVEKQHFDQARADKQSKAATRKRAAADDGGQALKRSAIGPSGAISPQEQPQMQSSQAQNREREIIADRDLERQKTYNKRTYGKTDKKSKKLKGCAAATKESKVELYSPLDDFINARTREELHCRRVPVKLYFDGLTPPMVDHHLECDKSLSTGCTRCVPHKSLLCCDICNPEHFNPLFTNPPPPKQTRALNRTCVKWYQPSTKEQDLKTALKNWRHEQALIIVGPLNVRKYGNGLFMSDETIQRLVDCAHANKISTCDQIEKETRWRRDWIDQCSESLLSVIRAHAALPTAAVEPQHQLGLGLGAATNVAQGPGRRKTVQCSACKQIGHNSKSLFVSNMPYIHLHLAHRSQLALPSKAGSLYTNGPREYCPKHHSSYCQHLDFLIIWHS